ncbi:unnamed protein product [Schistocephalus solidus]|uniref:3-ketoacyl-CoA thiolase n=1 Tax=Schistocephalus solidus TaxID=70667 RepID=A0A3P7DVS6_SCHSO|nr:unnamed protein product [Schistocephalus solidus]
MANQSCTDLAEHASRACLAESRLPPSAIDSVIFGNVCQSSKDTAYLARHVCLRIGIPETTPAMSVNRMCGSGLQSVVSAAMEIAVGQSHVVLAGGAENMSLAPFTLHGPRYGVRRASDMLVGDVLWDTLTDYHINVNMAVTAENLAKRFNIGREECDIYALRSQVQWRLAQENGLFKKELVAVPFKDMKGKTGVLETDEHPRETSMEALGKLKPAFQKGGVVKKVARLFQLVGINDGAAALIVASEELVRKAGIHPLARIVGFAVTGCDPSIMGIGPVSAITRLMQAVDPNMVGCDVNKYCDLIEVNEAFAAQYLAVEKALNLERTKTNINGGAIAIGHPVGASGSRILGHLAHRLSEASPQKMRAVGSACIGGGQGMAVLLESI